MRQVLTQLENATTFAERKQIIKNHFPSTRKHRGSSRIVIPISNDKVLKIAYNNKGIEQNKVEHDVYYHIRPYYKRYLARVFSASDNGTWLIQQKVKPVKGCNPGFIYSLPILRQILKYHFDLVTNDLDQVGFVGNRQVLFDYGLSEDVWRTWY